MNEQSFAEKLIALRRAKGATQDEVAKYLSLSGKTVSKWETGASTPDLPTLVKLSGYFGVTTDTLLGLSDGKSDDTSESVASLFDGLDRRKSILKAFEAERAIIPAIYGKFARTPDTSDDCEDCFPSETAHHYRSVISANDLFKFTASSEDINLSVTLLPNKHGFSWLGDPEKQKRIARFFRFLSDPDSLTVIYFIHSVGCSDSFTADYVSGGTGLSEEHVTGILNEFCDIGDCRSFTAHLAEGDTRIYECFGDGIILSVISLAFERMCGSRLYSYNCNNGCRMIGGK